MSAGFLPLYVFQTWRAILTVFFRHLLVGESHSLAVFPAPLGSASPWAWILNVKSDVCLQWLCLPLYTGRCLTDLAWKPVLFAS